MINFPNSPTPSQLYTYNNKTWEWNGVYWEVYSALTSYITSAYTVGDGISSISGVSSGNLALKSFSGIGITIINDSDKLTFSSSTNNSSFGEFLPLSGGTVTGDTVFTSGFTADTITFKNIPSQPIIEGRLGWNDTDGTLDLGMKGGNVTQQIGMEQFILAKSLTNSGIQEGYVYYLTGSTGGNKNVLLAQSNDSNTSKSTIGVATESSTGGNKAFITTFGLVRGLPDSLFVGINEGDTLYLSDTTPGRFQSTAPTQPNHRVRIGYCIRKQSNNNDIFVSVQLGLDLGELCNVYVPSPFNGDYLVYDQSNLRWKNMSPPISVTSVTFNNNTLTYANSTGGTFTNVINTLTGLTINGNLNVTGTTSSSIISATTYQNLPDNTTGIYLPLSGGTVTGNTNFTQGLTANTISATTYENITQKTGTLTLISSGWSGNQQTLTVNGVTTTSVNFISLEDSTNGDLWGSNKVYATSQGTNSITFTCQTTPSSDITFKVIIIR